MIKSLLRAVGHKWLVDWNVTCLWPMVEDKRGAEQSEITVEQRAELNPLMTTTI